MIDDPMYTSMIRSSIIRSDIDHPIIIHSFIDDVRLMTFGKFAVAIVIVIVAFWLIGGLLRGRTRR